jgi:hypothetical protein
VMPDGRTRFDRPVQGRGNAREQRRRVIDALVAAAMVNRAAFGGDEDVFISWVQR